MYISRRWINKFLDIPSVKDEEITVALNSLGFEVDSYKNYSGLNDKLRIGQVGSVSPIEGTHLNFCFVDINEELPSSIVCGADNIKEGQFVLVATPGTKLANGLTIQKTDIRGKSSEGMICALTEIGFDNSKILESEAKSIYVVNTKDQMHSHLGKTNALDVIGFNDSIWEVDLTLNRSDALGAFQILKELANYFKVSINGYKIFDEKIYGYNPEKNIDIKLDTKCNDFVRSLATATIEKKQLIVIDEKWENKIYSDDDIWLRNCGAKPSGNLFKDICDIVALETGQPLILIDPEKVKSGLSIINKPTEKREVELKLVDGNEEVAVFGVSINEKYLPTKDSKEILAIFPSLDPIFMRKQQKAFNLSTISMQRYMKPISSQLYGQAYERMLQILDRYELVKSISDINIIKDSNETAAKITVEEKYLLNLLGIELKSSEVIPLFEQLDFDVTYNDGVYQFIVDQNRTDISMPADIAEEVARLYGYDNIKPQPLILKSVMKKSKFEYILKNQLEGFLLGNGFANIKTYSLLGKETVKKWDLFEYGSEINLAMPLSGLHETYRLSLIPSLIETTIFNSNKGNKNTKLYEFADTYNMNEVREKHLGLSMCGEVIESKAHRISVKLDWFYFKGVIESIIGRYNINVNDLEFKNVENTLEEVHPYINAKIIYKGEVIGFAFKLNPMFEEKNKISQTFVADLSISKIEKLSQKNIVLGEISKFQKTSRDLSIILDSKVEYSNVIRDITKDVKYIENIQLSDIYSDEELNSKNEKSITITFTFNDANMQLTDEIINNEFNKVIENTNKKGLKIR